jgi:hypothetical protein
MAGAWRVWRLRLILKNVRRITLRVSREANFSDLFRREGGERGDGASTFWNEEVSGCLCLTPSAPSAVNFFRIGVGLFFVGRLAGTLALQGAKLNRGIRWLRGYGACWFRLAASL